jgi:hypothetical protein
MVSFSFSVSQESKLIVYTDRHQFNVFVLLYLVVMPLPHFHLFVVPAFLVPA